MSTSTTGPPSYRPRKYLRVDDMLIRYGISRATLYRKLKSKGLMKPSYLYGLPRWLESDLDEHDDEHMLACDSAMI